MSESFEKRLSEEADKLSITLNHEQIQKFDHYYRLLYEWNQEMNLTAVNQEEEVIVRHFADSLSIVKAIPEWQKVCNGKKVIDVGSGAGFPGLPLKIVYSDVELTLIDSLGKRVRFLRAVSDELGLLRVEALHGRAEEYGRNPLYREQYDFCVSRAVAELCVLAEYCLPFLKEGGLFTAYKSADIDEELKNAANAINVLGGEVLNVSEVCVGDAKRTLVVIKKIKETPQKYPRRAGKPKRDPL